MQQVIDQYDIELCRLLVFAMHAWQLSEYGGAHYPRAFFDFCLSFTCKEDHK